MKRALKLKCLIKKCIKIVLILINILAMMYRKFCTNIKLSFLTAVLIHETFAKHFMKSVIEHFIKADYGKSHTE